MQNIIYELIESSISKFKDKAYVLSPLGRVALKFGRDEKELMNEIYLEDLEMLILNELYNNNIRVQLLDDNLYKVTCKFKKFKNVVSLITAIMTDIFYRLFDEKVKIKLDCILKEWFLGEGTLFFANGDAVKVHFDKRDAPKTSKFLK